MSSPAPISGHPPAPRAAELFGAADHPMGELVNAIAERVVDLLAEAGLAPASSA